MTKAMDLLMWNLEVSDRDRVLPVIFELAEKVQSEHGIRVRPMRRWQLRKDLDSFAEIYNSAWSQNWDFVPYSKEDLDAYAQKLQLAFDKHWFMIAEREDTGEAVAMAITVPDLNQVLERMKGRILPFGWWHFLNKGRIIDRVRVGFLGVKPGNGKALQLDEKWAYNIVKLVGNYGESFERHVGAGSPLKLARGLNGLGTKGGLTYPIPPR